MMIAIGVAIAATILGGAVLAALRVQEAAWRRIARERRLRWENEQQGRARTPRWRAPESDERELEHH